MFGERKRIDQGKSIFTCKLQQSSAIPVASPENHFRILLLTVKSYLRFVPQSGRERSSKQSGRRWWKLGSEWPNPVQNVLLSSCDLVASIGAYPTTSVTAFDLSARLKVIDVRRSLMERLCPRSLIDQLLDRQLSPCCQALSHPSAR